MKNYTWKSVWKDVFLIWLLICTTMFLLPGDMFPEGRGMFGNIPHFDKLVHIGIFFNYSMLIYLMNRNFIRSIIISFVFTTFYGILIEFLQRIVDRGFDMYDYLADFIGVGLFFTVIFIYKVCVDYIKPKLN